MDIFFQNKSLPGGESFGTVVKMPLRTPVSCTGMPRFDSWLHLQFQLPPDAHPGSQQVKTQVVGSLPSKWEIQVQFPTLGFNLAQP